jgi:hypothetical protein
MPNVLFAILAGVAENLNACNFPMVYWTWHPDNYLEITFNTRPVQIRNSFDYPNGQLIVRYTPHLGEYASYVDLY